MAVVQASEKRKPTKLEREEWIAGWLFISPVVLGLIIWTLLPTVASLFLSFMDYRILRPPVWVGFDNYVGMFTRQPDFYIALKVTFKFVALQLPVGLLVALGGALLLNTGVQGMTVFRTFFYMPAVAPAVASALVWAWILNLNYGLVNQFVDALGFERINFFGNPKTALPSLAAMTWFSVGQTMIIYLAGLLNIPPSLYEAAEIDGANRVRKFVNITIPMLRPITLMVVILATIGAFQVFDMIYIMTFGGPIEATSTAVWRIYHTSFAQFKPGYGAAMGFVLFVVIMVVSLVQLRYFREEAFGARDKARGTRGKPV